MVPASRMRLAQRAWVLAAGLALAALAGGCGGARPSPGPAAPPGAARPGQRAPAAARPGEEKPGGPIVTPGGAAARPGYDQPPPSLRGLDTSALRGRRIVIDPGHGGRFPGSIGPTGLTEAEVNLGVALNLWGLLTDAGAQVELTRTTDRDFTTPSDSSLKGDLEARVEIARAFDPDVFVSIHHNADLSGRRDLNETQTYYRLADPLASLELARSVNARLASGLAIGADRLVPGNYFVVRNAPCPAMLGESSYLTNPDVEARLALASRQRLEATEYFLGLLDYFRRGVPRLLASGTAPGPAPSPAQAEDALERPWIEARTDRAPGTARLLVDGALVDTARVERSAGAAADSARGGWLLRYRPAEPLTDGRHFVEWTVEAAGGAWSRARADSFDVKLPPAHVAFTLTPDSARARPGQIVVLTARVLDRHGRALADTVVARFAARVGARMVDSLTAQAGARRVPGEARGYAKLSGGSLAEFTYAIARPRLPAALAAGRARLTLAPEAPGAPRVRTGFVRALTAAGAAPVAGALVRGPAPADTARANPDGFFALAADSLTAEAPGYVTADLAPHDDDLSLVPVARGALLGRRIVVDAAGGGADTTRAVADSMRVAAARADSARADTTRAHTTREDTTRAGGAAADSARALASVADSTARARVLEADANLRVARALAEALRAAGATVLLTRDAPDTLSAVDRLRASEGFGADRLLTISHRAAEGAASIGHYFASAPGKALAQRLAAALAARGLARDPQVAASPSFLVQQTAAVAAAVDLPAAGALYADSTRAAARLRAEAYALYLGLLADLGGDPAEFLPLDVRVTRDGAPAPCVPVELDHRWILFTGDDGMARFDGLPARSVVTVAAGPLVGCGLAPTTVRISLPAPKGVALALPCPP